MLVTAKRDHLNRVVTQLSEEFSSNSSSRATEFVRWASDILTLAEERMLADGLEALFDKEHVFGGNDDRGVYYNPNGW